MMDAIRELAIAAGMFAFPFYCGQWLPLVALFVWPFALVFLSIGVVDAFVAIG